MKPQLRLTVIVSTLSLLTACSLIPDYQRPEPTIDIVENTEAGSISVAELGWREFYRDPALQQLIQLALDNNQELRAASLSVEQLQKQYHIQRAARLPAVDVEGAASRERSPQALGFSARSGISEQYSVGLGITAWEIDFFGRIESLSQSALQQYFASQAARDSAQLSLIAEVADGWLSWQASRAQYQLATGTREVREESYRLIQKRFDNGLVSELDLRQAETAVHEASILEAQHQQQANQNFTTLQLLTGQTLDKSQWQADWQQIGQLQDIPANLSSEVLLQRPDVLQAEHQIKSANADIGAARAAFFPRISLTASLGLAGSEPAQLTETGSRQWQIAPQFTVPLLNFGVNQTNLDVSELQKDINIANYQQVIQQAFKEVRDQMEARYTLDEQIKAQNDLIAATERSLALARSRFDAGIDSYLDVLDAQRSAISSKLNQIDIRLQRLRNQLTLYKALGGGLLETTNQPGVEN
ncbi:efflux transporter outer membrane subunit [Methylophaga sp. OBS4]|uniref:efflux transporter outer membrane subunit n=1 Tax=Methylophaga sp. OBS4 TaxID=2991935 RepID=UPI002255C00A|nr:efflux transporter outer membrane subunit [Methylophaga sp. OBS4]MCX4187998.1 efflux transporter outer membrane subunit [Methylophaga sp. OBS4]